MLVSKSSWWDRVKHRLSRLSRRPMLLVFALSMLGVAMAAQLPSSVPWSWIAILASSLWVCLAIHFRDKLLLPAILMVLPMLSAWRYQSQEQQISRDRLHALSSDTWSPVVMEGTIDSTPRWRPDLLQLGDFPREADLTSDHVWETLVEIQVTAIRDRREWKRDEFGRILIAVQGRSRNLLPGDRVECMLDWQRISPPTNPGQYDLAEKYRRSGIFVRGRTDVPTQVKKIGVRSHLRLDRWLSRVVVAADIAFHRFVPYRQATLASALVLGQREQVEWSMQESLLATGTIHMLAISGMHIEMVAISVVVLCIVFRVPRHTMLFTTMAVVVAYSLLCGGNPPVARAAVLVVTLGISRWIGKTTNSLNLLGFAAVAVLLYRPSNWLEIGTQLSFLAVAVLILLKGEASEEAERRDYLDELLIATSHPIWKAWAYLKTYSFDLLRTSLWVWLLTAPLVLYRFNILSPVAVVLNLLLWIPMLLALLSGLVLLVVGPILPILGYPLGWVCGVNLWITDRIVQISEDIPMSHFWLPAPPFWWVTLYYVVAFLLIGLFGFGKHLRRIVFLFSVGWIAIGIVPSLDRQFWNWIPWNSIHASDQLSITFIDVGHGTSVLIQHPNSEVWLYDAGRLGDAQRSYLGIASVLWERRISKIDRLFISHADSDHFNAVSGLSKRFTIKRLITTQRTIDSHSPSLKMTLDKLSQQRVPIELCDEESKATSDSLVQCQFLHPPVEGVSGTDNANSLCLLIEFAGHRILLPGDLEGEGTRRLISKPKIPVSVLMAPHHGSLSENPKPLLEWCNPTLVIISGGPKARNPKVRAAFLEKSGNVLITAIEHAVRCTIFQSGQLRIEQWQYPMWVDCSRNEGP